MRETDNQFSFKELYNVCLRATVPIIMGDKTFAPNETVAAFEKIAIAPFDESVLHFVARGGYDNRDYVWWDTVRDVKLRFTQGVFSNAQLSLLTNTRLVELQGNELVLNRREIVESNEDSEIHFSDIPAGYLFIYDVLTGEKITSYDVLSEQSVKVSTSFRKYLLDYGFLYTNKSYCFVFGEALTNSFLRLEGRTRGKDDITGQVRTGIITIPRLKLMSNISMRLGLDGVPVAGEFSGLALPVGEKGNTQVMGLTFLNEDIDTDQH